MRPIAHRLTTRGADEVNAAILPVPPTVSGAWAVRPRRPDALDGRRGKRGPISLSTRCVMRPRSRWRRRACRWRLPSKCRSSAPRTGQAGRAARTPAWHRNPGSTPAPAGAPLRQAPAYRIRADDAVPVGQGLCQVVEVAAGARQPVPHDQRWRIAAAPIRHSAARVRRTARSAMQADVGRTWSFPRLRRLASYEKPRRIAAG